MNVSAVTAVGVVLVGLVAMLIGHATRRRHGRALIAFGAALIVGSLSPLSQGQVAESVRILFSVGAMVIAAAGLVVALADVRAGRGGTASR